MYYQKYKYSLLLITFISTSLVTSQSVGKDEPLKISQILIQPEITRCIQGHTILDRKKYFNLCDHGSSFDQRVSKEIYSELVHDYGVSFGRRLGGLAQWGSELDEDIKRPGFANLEKLKSYNPPASSSLFKDDFGPNLDVACHGNHNKYPEYMGKHFKGTSNYHGTPEWLPRNLDAAAELAASVLLYGYTDLDRPAYFEPLNEPHWEFWKDPHLVNWHLKTKYAIHKMVPSVKVGGPCLSVAYFYRDNYRLFEGIKYFMDETEGKMDFYSFHAYDFFRWDGKKFIGRIQSGLPLEGILDLVQNYSVNTFGEEKKIVLSEHGGYLIKAKGLYDGEAIADEIASKYFPGESFEYELKKRSIVNVLMIQAVMANTLTFMDHPHIIQKAVPFLIPMSWNWDKRYYAQLYVPYEYSDTSKIFSTHLLNFFKFFRGVEGRRVKALSNDPDLQVRAFVKDNKLSVIINNLSDIEQKVNLQGIESQNIELRRIGHNNDFSGFYKEEQLLLPKILKLEPLEAISIHLKYEDSITEKRRVDEKIYYGDKVTVPLKENEFFINVPDYQKIDYAQVRVGLTRDLGMSYEPTVKINGKEIDIPMEDCWERLEEKEYATTKIFLVNPKYISKKNRILVSFNDNNKGAIGSVVLRAGIKE